VTVACALALAGAWTLNGLAFTVALFTVAALWLGWAAVEAAADSGSE